jgi:hypothetical protein
MCHPDKPFGTGRYPTSWSWSNISDTGQQQVEGGDFTRPNLLYSTPRCFFNAVGLPALRHIVRRRVTQHQPLAHRYSLVSDARVCCAAVAELSDVQVHRTCPDQSADDRTTGPLTKEGAPRAESQHSSRHVLGQESDV